MMKKMHFLVTGIVLMATVFVGCAKKGVDFGFIPTPKAGQSTPSQAAVSGSVTMSGSTSMESLVNALGDAFSKANDSKVTVDVQAGGSSVGVTNAKDGITDIGNSSRSLKDDEKAFGLKETVIALDGIAVVVNPANAVVNLTKDQIAKIFTGEIKNWKEVGGKEKAIVVVGREAGSGTRDGFEGLLKIKDKCKYTVEVNETGIVKTKVASEAAGIGYISLGVLDTTVKALQVEGVAPSEKTVKDTTYVLQRPFICLTKAETTPQTTAFLDFMGSPAGQEIVQKKGFVTVT